VEIFDVTDLLRLRRSCSYSVENEGLERSAPRVSACTVDPRSSICHDGKVATVCLVALEERLHVCSARS
jgi:hypothetical protein